MCDFVNNGKKLMPLSDESFLSYFRNLHDIKGLTTLIPNRAPGQSKKEIRYRVFCLTFSKNLNY